MRKVQIQLSKNKLVFLDRGFNHFYNYRCATPEKMAHVSFQDLYKNKTRLICLNNDPAGDSSSPHLLASVISFLSGTRKITKYFSYEIIF